MCERCLICSERCLKDELQCQKGEFYFQQDNLTNKMIKCGHLLMHKAGKKRGQEKILDILFSHELLSQKQLQEILQIKAGSLSEILAKLERNGFIERYRDEKDKRRWMIVLTPKGKDKVKYKKTNDEDMFDMLSWQEKQQLDEMLDKILIQWYKRYRQYHQ